MSTTIIVKCDSPGCYREFDNLMPHIKVEFDLRPANEEGTPWRVATKVDFCSHRCAAIYFSHTSKEPGQTS